MARPRRRRAEAGVTPDSISPVAEEAGARLSFRVNPALKSLIERAALYSGETVTSYAVSTLADAARRVVREHEMTMLSDRDRDLFLDLLDNPPPPNEALRRAAASYRERIVERKPA
ncbi:MAG TPA: DUF1778 domain-containing protein [Longimicrobium sp.]|nr:DUF1778 domain-containing protein [Longimicrobium sp.]